MKKIVDVNSLALQKVLNKKNETKIFDANIFFFEANSFPDYRPFKLNSKFGRF